jgi:exopolyphosphatase/guanosine-5'-triphosphate,3'-diphosphate pyrophosphatase
MTPMRVAVVDIGSNTARLLVADVEGAVVPVREERTYLGLAADILLEGAVSKGKRRDAAAIARRYSRLAARLDAQEVATVITAPGRQGEGSSQLVDALRQATGGPVRILSAEEEGRFAFVGATAQVELGREVVAVCDVGGGSTELAIGTALLGPAWVRSADVGSLRLTKLHFGENPPDAATIDRARAAAKREVEALAPPRAERVLAVGGSARAAAKIVGRTIEPSGLASLVDLATRRPTGKIARAFGLDEARAETLLAGALILAEIARLLEAPLQVVRGGLREGIALTLAGRATARAA